MADQYPSTRHTVDDMQLQKKCKDLEFEAASHERRISQQGEVESHLRETSVALALAEGRASDFARRLADQESTSSTLQLRLKVQRDVSPRHACCSP